LVNQSEGWSGKSDLSKASRAVNFVLIGLYVCFFAFYPVYRLCLQRYFTVTSMRGQHAMNKAKSKLSRDKKRAARMKQLQDYED